MAHPAGITLPSPKQTPDSAKGGAWILPFSLLVFVISIDSVDTNSFGPVMAQIKAVWRMTNTNAGT